MQKAIISICKIVSRAVAVQLEELKQLAMYLHRCNHTSATEAGRIDS